MAKQVGRAMNKTDKARVLDMDGNLLAVFPGYAWPGLAYVLESYPRTFKVQVVNRRGFTSATINCSVA
jgi:hypothetical protein